MMTYALRPKATSSGRAVRQAIVLLLMQRPSGGTILWNDFKIDTGADRIVVPTACAVGLGIDLGSSPVTPFTVATGTRLIGWEAEVDLLATDSAGHATRWTAPVVFAPVNSYLAGYVGFLEFFDLHLFSRTVRLDPRKNVLPGVTSC
jgi:hypothetical protein